MLVLIELLFLQLLAHRVPLLSLLDLVALGTVCDVVPLTGLNRVFVRQGLTVMARRRNLGLAALADVAGVNEALKAYHAGFVLGPRVNAGGRVGEANLGATLLTTKDAGVAQRIAKRLDDHNQERRAHYNRVQHFFSKMLPVRNPSYPLSH